MQNIDHWPPSHDLQRDASCVSTLLSDSVRLSYGIAGEKRIKHALETRLPMNWPGLNFLGRTDRRPESVQEMRGARVRIHLRDLSGQVVHDLIVLNMVYGLQLPVIPKTHVVRGFLGPRVL